MLSAKQAPSVTPSPITTNRLVVKVNRQRAATLFQFRDSERGHMIDGDADNQVSEGEIMKSTLRDGVPAGPEADPQQQHQIYSWYKRLGSQCGNSGGTGTCGLMLLNICKYFWFYFSPKLRFRQSNFPT